LVHGVFGTLMRRGAALPDPPSLPPDVAGRWAAAWGEDMVADAARALASPPPLDIAFRPGQDIALDGVGFMPGHLRLARGETIAGLAGFDEGLWWVQDIAASIPARLLGAGEGRRVLDLCAAPGGKTMQLAAAGFAVTAVDQSESRLERLRENLQRTGLAAEVVARDVMTYEPKGAVDAILLDAPCSATGIFRRHPDVLYRVRTAAIRDLAETQAAMLARAAAWLEPGGTLVYSVCSLEHREGESVVEAFLAANPGFTLDPVTPDELPDDLALAANGMVRILPGMLADRGGSDSFFIARLRRNERAAATRN
jgi:16S rRNA (cytosine967-C5)-methyltransferase